MSKSALHTRLSSLDGQELEHAVLERFRIDFDWRNEMIGAEGFDECSRLFEAESDENPEDATIPRVNLIRRAVEDYLAVAITNIPKAKLYAERNIPHYLPKWEREIRAQVTIESEIVLNAYVKTILNKNQYNDLAQLAVKAAGVYGVGYLKHDIDRTNNVRRSYELRDILMKEDLSNYDLDRLAVLAKRIDLEHVDTKDVYWEAGRRRVDHNMLRVSLVERHSVLALREAFQDKVEHPELIMPGKFPHEIDEKPSSGIDGNTMAAVVTMWEIEEVEKEKLVEGPDGEEIPIPFTDTKIVKVVIAGGQLVEKSEVVGIPDDDSDEEPGALRLPITPYYLRESTRHPYGFAIPRMLKLSEEFINSMRTIAFRSAKKAVSNQGVVVMTPNLGKGDLQELDAVLDEGGVARIKGNSQGPIDVRDIVMPLNYNASQISPALMEAVGMEMQMFQTQSQAVDPQELASARTGAAKRAQMSVADRPKGLSIAAMSRAVEAVYESVYELVRVHHTDEIGVAVDLPGGGRTYVTINEPYRRKLVVQEDEARTRDNPYGFVVEEFDAVLNETATPMYAQAEGRGGLPLDMMQRFQILMALTQAGAIVPETFRNLGLDDEIRDIDDSNRAKMAAQQQMMALAQQQFDGGGQGGPQGPMNPMAGAPQQGGLLGGGAGPEGGLAPTMQDQAADSAAGLPMMA